MLNFSYYLPTHFVFGRGAEEKAGEMTRQAGGTRVLIHYGGGSALAQRPDWQGGRFPETGRQCTLPRWAARSPIRWRRRCMRASG